MARMIEKALLAGAIGITSIAGAGCSFENGHVNDTSLVPSRRDQVVTLNPGYMQVITNIAAICAGRTITINENSFPIPLTIEALDKNGHLEANSAALVKIPASVSVDLYSTSKDPIYCEAQNTSQAEDDVKAKFPKGTQFVVYSLTPPTPTKTTS